MQHRLPPLHRYSLTDARQKRGLEEGVIDPIRGGTVKLTDAGSYDPAPGRSQPRSKRRIENRCTNLRRNARTIDAIGYGSPSADDHGSEGRCHDVPKGWFVLLGISCLGQGIRRKYGVPSYRGLGTEIYTPPVFGSTER